MDAPSRGDWEALAARLRPLPGAVVAFSGGVDSGVLLAACVEVLGVSRVLGAIADSPSLARRELAEARAFAAELGVELTVLGSREFEDPRYRANRGDRCYWCKEGLFTAAAPLARSRGWSLLYGENADDDPADRPGARSARERGVRAPLREAGWGKARVRAWARARGLPLADKPAAPCLASRIPVGVVVTPEALRRVEELEDALRARDFRVLRAREDGHGGVRLVFGAEELPRALAMAPELEGLARAVGYSRGRIDPIPYGSAALPLARIGKARGTD